MASIKREDVVRELEQAIYRDAPDLVERRRKWIEAAEKGEHCPYLRTLLNHSEALVDRVLGKPRQTLDLDTGPIEVRVVHDTTPIEGVGLDDS